MNDFLKSLTAFGMEGMNIEVESVEAYEGSEVAEELMEIDNLEAQTIALESMSDAIMEGALEMQNLALEAAGLELGTASQFTGELSTESVANMAKRGYYEVKIQVKKVIQKIWKLILSIVDQVMGSDGRLKSYGKLFKKYSERLSKINPKDGKDGDEREVTIREWEKAGVVADVKSLKLLAGDSGWIKKITSGIKAVKVEDSIQGLLDGCKDFKAEVKNFLMKAGGMKDGEANKVVAQIPNINAKWSKSKAEAIEKAVEESLKDLDAKEWVNELVEKIKDVDSEDYPILTAKANLLSIGRALEEECKKDLKFKKDLIKLRKAWDKKTGEWDLTDLKAADGKSEASQDAKDAIAAILRTLNKFGPVITGYRMVLSKIYSAVASNMQGCLADMAKVIAKGTNIGA